MTGLGNNSAPGATAQDQAEQLTNYRTLQRTDRTWREDSSIHSGRLPVEPHAKGPRDHDSTPSSVTQNEPESDVKQLREISSTSNHQPSGQIMMQIPDSMILDLNTRRLLKEAPRYPPVTKKTLSELDLGWIMNNINLRCDVNYDNDLHFVPIGGKRGNDKRQQAKTYWTALAHELQIYQSLSCKNEMKKVDLVDCDTFARRLPDMFASLKELLEALVPYRDHISVAEHLDIDLLMQQIVKGVLDIAGLARWLADLLKRHCAPMRDDLADGMSKTIERGIQQQSMNEISNGLEQLFALLEAMKLDVANHQIRTFQLLLIDDTVQFQRDFFRERIRERKLDPSSARLWYQDSLRDFENSSVSQFLDRMNVSTPSNKRIQPLLYRLVCDLTSSLPTIEYPSTFTYDLLRLVRLRDVLQDLFYLRICFYLLNEIIGDLSRGRHLSAPSPVYAMLEQRVFAILNSSGEDTSDQISKVWRSNLHSISLEILSAAHSTLERSGSLDELDLARKYPDDEIKHTYDRLAYLTQNTLAHQHIISQTRAELVCCTLRHINRFNGMGPRAISDEQGNWISQRASESPNTVDHSKRFSILVIEDTARRLAHILVLNWRVWADLCYLSDLESPIETQSQGETTLPQSALNDHAEAGRCSADTQILIIAEFEAVDTD